MKKKLLFTLRHAPYGNELAKEAIDVILASAAYEQILSVVFLDDGVFQLLPEQQAESIHKKSLFNTLSALPLYDVTRLFVCESSLTQRGIAPDHIPNHINMINGEDLQQLYRQQDHLLSF